MNYKVLQNSSFETIIKLYTYYTAHRLDIINSNSQEYF